LLGDELSNGGWVKCGKNKKKTILGGPLQKLKTAKKKKNTTKCRENWKKRKTPEKRRVRKKKRTHVAKTKNAQLGRGNRDSKKTKTPHTTKKNTKQNKQTSTKKYFSAVKLGESTGKTKVELGSERPTAKSSRRGKPQGKLWNVARGGGETHRRAQGLIKRSR